VATIEKQYEDSSTAALLISSIESSVTSKLRAGQECGQIYALRFNATAPTNIWPNTTINGFDDSFTNVLAISV
jgi:hypothetical protein